MPRDTELVRIRKVRGAATKRLARAASTARRAIYRVQQAQIVIARCDAERQAHEHAGDIEWHRAQLAAARGPAPVPAMPLPLVGSA